MPFIELAISRVTSLTFALIFGESVSRWFIIGSTLVPENIATKLAFFPLLYLLVIMVYSSPLDKAASSIDNLGPMFSGKRR